MVPEQQGVGAVPGGRQGLLTSPTPHLPCQWASAPLTVLPRPDLPITPSLMARPRAARGPLPAAPGGQNSGSVSSFTSSPGVSVPAALRPLWRTPCWSSAVVVGAHLHTEPWRAPFTYLDTHFHVPGLHIEMKVPQGFRVALGSLSPNLEVVDGTLETHLPALHVLCRTQASTGRHVSSHPRATLPRGQALGRTALSPEETRWTGVHLAPGTSFLTTGEGGSHAPRAAARGGRDKHRDELGCCFYWGEEQTSEGNGPCPAGPTSPGLKGLQGRGPQRLPGPAADTGPRPVGASPWPG